METGYFHRVTAQTPTRFWINNVTREEANLALDAGAVGCTQNPSYTFKLMGMAVEKEYVFETLAGIMREEKDDVEALVKLQKNLIARIAQIFMPLHEKTRGRQGYVSIQGDPLQEDFDSIVRFARFNRKDTPPNMMAKVPATPEGLKARGVLLREGVPINATEIMSVRQALDVFDVYRGVSEEMANPPAILYSHIAGIFDEYMLKHVKAKNIDISPDIVRQGGLAVARKIESLYADLGYQGVGFISGGARGLHHFTDWVGSRANVTINWLGTAKDLIEQNPPVIDRFRMSTPDYVIEELVEKIEEFRKAYFTHAIEPDEYEEYGPVELFRGMFVESWKGALREIKSRR
jgi:transaldolase